MTGENGQLIVFLDNSVSRIYKTVESLNKEYLNITVLTQEKDLLDFITGHEAALVFLNLDLQPNDAVAVLKEIRQLPNGRRPLVVIYTEKNDDFVQELALNSGADSFIHFHHKPSVMGPFIKNLLRRRVREENKSTRELVIDTERYKVFKKGMPVQLPRKEFRLFELLYNHPEKFFSKKEIAQVLWNDENIAGKRIIDVHIYNIRQLLGRRCIQSQKGKGYRINKLFLG